LMREHDIGAIPIGENDRLIGMVTDRDIVCKGLAQDSFDAGRAACSNPWRGFPLGGRLGRSIRGVTGC
jgi:CBS-domain-containing membrane protein